MSRALLTTLIAGAIAGVLSGCSQKQFYDFWDQLAPELSVTLMHVTEAHVFQDSENLDDFPLHPWATDQAFHIRPISETKLDGAYIRWRHLKVIETDGSPTGALWWDGTAKITVENGKFEVEITWLPYWTQSPLPPPDVVAHYEDLMTTWLTSCVSMMENEAAPHGIETIAVWCFVSPHDEDPADWWWHPHVKNFHMGPSGGQPGPPTKDTHPHRLILVAKKQL